MERRLRPTPSSALGIPHGIDPRHGADRDHPGRVRDGRDPLRAARPRLRAQRRPLGLPVQHHQVLPRRRPGLRAARPRRGDDDRADDAGLHRAARRRPATGAARSRSAGWRRSSRAAATPRSTSAALAKVREDKEREAGDGFDGSWVAHPDLVPSARRSSTACSATGPTSSTGCATTCRVTRRAAARRRRRRRASAPMAGLRGNVEVGVRYLAAWLGGNGAVGIHNLMEDAATAEISPLAGLAVGAQRRRARHRRDASTAELVRRVVDEEVAPAIGELRRDLRRRPAAVRAGRAGRRLRRLPDPAGLRADPGLMPHARPG